MIIDKQLGNYVVYYEDSIEYALKKMNLNGKRHVYCLSESGVLEAIVADGDFRRWVVSAPTLDLQLSVKEIANTEFVKARENDNKAYINSLFSSKITSVPIIDEYSRLVAIAWKDSKDILIGDRPISDEKPSFIIAEIGNNHNGSLSLAKTLIEKAAEAGADCAKFQLRDLSSIYAESGKVLSEDLGSEYTLDLLKRFQLTPGEMIEALDYSKKCGLIPMCTPWDINSLKVLDEYGVGAFKIASADLTNHELIVAAAKTGKTLILSTGMSRENEILDTVNLLQQEGTPFILLQCNSTYPTPMQDINLAYMDRLKQISGNPVGYSGHERGYEICIAAVARGARVIEKHFTIDKAMEGSDHKVSLLPDEFASMVAAIRNTELAIGNNKPRDITQGERLNREVLAKSLIAKQDIRIGQKISVEMVEAKSPGRGLQPSRLNDLVGLIATRNLKAGDIFYESDILGEKVKPRNYQFDRPWGVPVRYHDIHALIKEAPVDLIEIHFSYRDLDLNPSNYFSEPLTCGLVVHSPELFSGDHLMDLCSVDDTYRARSIAELQRVIERTIQLKEFFPNTKKPSIIINAGGFTLDKFMPVHERKVHYEMIGEALSILRNNEVEIIPQTMPPFPWHFGGQRFHNLFMDADEIIEFCERYSTRVCFDTSHSKLACNYFGWSFSEFTQKVAKYTAHLHIVDARGHHDEGLQIGDGEIDFQLLSKELKQYAAGISFIPEIWQGHKNDGEGFWVALDCLEEKFKSVRNVETIK